MTQELINPGDEFAQDLFPVTDDLLQPGNYLYQKDGDLLYLITKVVVYDGLIHSIDTTTIDQAGRCRTYQFKYDEALGLQFDPNGARKREAQRQETLVQIGHVQQKLKEIASNRPEPPKLLASYAIPSSEDQAKQQIALSQEYAQQVTEFKKAVTEVNAELANKSRELSSRMEEHTAYLTAGAADTNAEIDHIKEQVYSLQSFTLDNVGFAEVMRGEPAPGGAPLTLYQRMLYMDEELAVHADLDSGQARGNHRDPKTLSQKIEENPALLDRLIPAKRGAVLIQFSRKTMGILLEQQVSSMQKAFENMAKMDYDKARFILTRDGLNVNIIYLPEQIWKGTDHLFPNQHDLDQLFLDERWGKEPQRIKFSDLHYRRARDTHDSIMQAYRRLLLVVTGAQLTRQVFGKLPNDNTGMRLTTHEYHATEVRYIHDVEEGLSDNTRPDIHDWFIENQRVYPGATILLSRRSIWQPEALPAMFRYVERSSEYAKLDYDLDDQEGQPDNNYLICSVQGSAENPFVTLNFHYTGYNDRTEKRDKSARVLLNALKVQANLEYYRGADRYYSRSERAGYAFINLDAITIEDITHYLEGRRYRNRFEQYFPLLSKALHTVKTLPTHTQHYEERQGVTKGWQQQAAKFNATAVTAPKNLPANSVLYVKVWNQPGTYYKAAPSSYLHATTRELVQDELPDTLILDAQDNIIPALPKRTIIHQHYESLVGQLPEATINPDLATRLNTAQNIIEETDWAACNDALARAFAKNPTDPDFNIDEIYLKLNSAIDKNRGRTVPAPRYLIPVGLRKNERGKITQVCAQVFLLEYLYHHSEEGRAMAIRWIRNNYHMKEHNIDRISKSTPIPGLIHLESGNSLKGLTFYQNYVEGTGHASPIEMDGKEYEYTKGLISRIPVVYEYKVKSETSDSGYISNRSVLVERGAE